jgi:thiol-disulfide isomerase/thioredoxin
MRLAISLLFFSLTAAAAESPVAKLWDGLKAKREALAEVHQEFDVSQTYRLQSGNQSVKRQVVLDMSGPRWRQKSVSGSGARIRIFDGEDLFSWEEGGDEFLRVKRHPKDDDPLPPPYSVSHADWSKATETERRPCGLSGADHSCAILEVPLTPWMASSGSDQRMQRGLARLSLDTETGLLLSIVTVEAFESRRGGYKLEVRYALKRMTYGAAPEAALFALPAGGLHEVKKLSRWNAAKIRTQLTGKPAPELAVTDLQGKPLSLAEFRGRTVLLDFWTTWCPPCRADAPALEKLYHKYADHDLAIIGVSVSEDRAVVEQFLKAHPHSFPVVLTTENEMPLPYQISAFPTYIVIDRDGTVISAVEGDQGFADLRKLLRNAGLEID